MLLLIFISVFRIANSDAYSTSDSIRNSRHVNFDVDSQVSTRVQQVIRDQLDRGNFQYALKIIDSEIAKSLDDELTLAKLFFYKGFAKYGTGNADALPYFQKALSIYLKNKNHEQALMCYYMFADLFYRNSDFLTSMKFAIDGLRYAQTHEIDNAQIRLLIWIGVASMEQGDASKALEYYSLAHTKAAQNGRAEVYHGIIFTNLGGLYFSQRDYKNALSHYNAGLKYAVSRNDLSLQAHLWDNIAKTYIALEKYPLAFSYLKKAQAFRNRHNIRIGTQNSFILFSEYYFAIGDIQHATKYANLALEIAANLNSTTDLLAGLRQKIKVDSKTSTEAALQYIAIKDSLEVAERNNRNKFARIAYETDQIIKEKDQAVKEKKFALAGTGVLLLFGACAYIITAQRSRQKEMFYIQEQQRSNEAIYQLIHDQQQKIEEGRTMEKRRIASELHDGVMNRLASTRLNLFILNRRRDAQTIEQCLPHIDGIRYIEQEIRRMAHDLEGGEKGIETSFTIVLEKFFDEQRQICDADLHAFVAPEIDWVRIDSTVKINIYRILQEAIQNCYKYAEAQNIFVTIKKEGNLHHIVISDDGLGFRPKKQRNGIGLRNMKQRTKALSGIFKICSQPGHGTTILITIPINETAYENS